MNNFRVYMPTAIVFGPGELKSLGKETAALGKKALIITGRSSTRKTGLLDRATKLLREAGVEAVVFDRIEPNPRHTTCDAAAELARREGCDVIVALGGGSPIDASKAIAAAAAMGCSSWDFTAHEGGDKTIAAALPIVAVPTTAATGSEADWGAVISNWETHEKTPLFSYLVIPKVAICDPELHLTLPADVTADGCVDILSHYLESYLSGEPDCSVQDGITEGLMNTAFEWGPVAYRDGRNLRARRELQYASTLALTGVPNNGRGGHWVFHALEHSLSGHYDIAHGRGLAVLMPRGMRLFFEDIYPRLAKLGRRCFHLRGDDDRAVAEAAIKEFVLWLDGIGESLTLGDVGIGDEKFEAMVDDVLRNYGDGEAFQHVRKLYKKDLIKLLAMCLEPNH